MLLSLTGISKSYGDRTVLRDVALMLDRGQAIGLVGANGAGKTTLLKIIAGVEVADRGGVALANDARIGYLPQTLASTPTVTLGAFIDGALGDLQALQARLRMIEHALAAPQDDLQPLLAEYAQVQERFERRGGYAMEHRYAAIAAGLEIEHLARTRPLSSLSGGEATRVGLAALLLSTPDLLLLDEPTNYLDFAALGWLERYIEQYQGGVLVVSHDRHFLNRTVDAIVEIDEHAHTAHLYSGSYDAFAAAKAQAAARWAEAYAAQRDEIRLLQRTIREKARQVAHNRGPRDGDKMAYDFKGGRVEGTVARNVRNAEERLRRIQSDPLPRPPKPLTLNPDFDPDRLVSHTPLLATSVSKCYGENPVLQDVSVALERHSRVAIVGPNGSGKSTLLRILAGVEQPDAGEVRVAPSVVVGYLDQDQETLPRHGTVLASFRGDRQGDPEAIKAELLGYGFFTYPDLLKPVGALSIGQLRKLKLAQLLAAHANLLLLDEPTNHLSLDVVERFEAALEDFPGAIIAVSHDRHFLRRFATEVWTVRDGRLLRQLGPWEG